MPSRRAFVRVMIASGIGLHDAAMTHAVTQVSRSFRGSTPGQERDVERIRLCWCPPGQFLMGSPLGETGRRSDEAQVRITLTRGFWMAKFEATQGQWTRLMGAFPERQPSAEFGLGDVFPVYWVSYLAAEAFCRRLSANAVDSGALPPGWEFRLPTEAQWEYACRAGTVTATSFGDQLGRHQANFQGEPLAARPVPRRVGRQRLAATRRTRGACATCTATSSNGAATGTTPSCPAAPILISTARRPRRTVTRRIRASGAAARGMTTGGSAGQRSGYVTNPNAPPITSASGV